MSTPLMGFLTKFYRQVVVPTYHVLFIFVVIWGAGSFLALLLVPLLDSLLERLTGIDLSPVGLTGPARWAFVGIGGVFLGAAIFAWRQVLIIRRRTRHLMGEVRHALETHFKFCDKISHMQSSKSSTVRAEASDMAREYVIELCGRVSQIFEGITQSNCHTSVKSFNQTNGMVATRARDALPHNRERGQTDEALESFHFAENTAFERIINNPNCYMYTCNWLRLMHMIGKYKNRNPDWSKFYTATVVLPITLNRSAGGINETTVIGFICVDNKHSFNQKHSRAVLLIFVMLLHHIMVLLGWNNPTTIGAHRDV